MKVQRRLNKGKDAIFEVWLDRTEISNLDAMAKAANMTMSALLKAMALGETIKLTIPLDTIATTTNSSSADTITWKVNAIYSLAGWKAA